MVPQDDIIKKFIVDRLKIIAVAKKYISMPKMRAIPQMVSAPLNPIPELQNILGRAIHNVSKVTDTHISEDNNAK